MAIQNLKALGTTPFDQQGALFLAIEEGFERFGGEVLAGMGEFVALKLQELSPVKTGRLRASVNLSSPELSYTEMGALGAFPVAGLDVWGSALDSMRKLHPGFVTMGARAPGAEVSYAGVINLGRHVDSRGRQAGSLQAPEGMTGPALQALDANFQQIVDTAAVRAGLA